MENRKLLFARTKESLIADGWNFRRDAVCKYCNAAIEWYETPRGKYVAISADTCEIHAALCGRRVDYGSAMPLGYDCLVTPATESVPQILTGVPSISQPVSEEQ